MKVKFDFLTIPTEFYALIDLVTLNVAGLN